LRSRRVGLEGREEWRWAGSAWLGELGVEAVRGGVQRMPPVLGTRVDPTSYGAATQQGLGWARRGESRYVCMATVHSVMEAWGRRKTGSGIQWAVREVRAWERVWMRRCGRRLWRHG
jgi:hypothetical protein